MCHFEETENPICWHEKFACSRSNQNANIRVWGVIRSCFHISPGTHFPYFIISGPWRGWWSCLATVGHEVGARGHVNPFCVGKAEAAGHFVFRFEFHLYFFSDEFSWNAVWLNIKVINDKSGHILNNSNSGFLNSAETDSDSSSGFSSRSKIFCSF